MQREYTHDGQILSNAIRDLNRTCPDTLAGLNMCITGIVPGYKGNQAEAMAYLAGASKTTKQVSSKTQLLVVGDNAGRAKIERAEYFNTPTITASEFLALI